MSSTNSHPLRWGFLGTGSIAHQFAEGLRDVAGASLTAVCSRSLDNANKFAQTFGVKAVEESYEAMLGNDDVDCVYVATPHHAHREFVERALDAGKGVLCEKPLGISATEVGAMIAAAERSGSFLMEGMWMRFIPSISRFLDLVDEGLIGEPRLLRADFSFRVPMDSKGRLFDLNQAGGALLDVGIYPLFLSRLLFGTPTKATSVAGLASTGVDEQAQILLAHEGGAQSSLSCSTRVQMPITATLYGTSGALELPSPFFAADHLIHYPGADPDQADDLQSPEPTSGLSRLKKRVGSRLRYPKGELAPRKIACPYRGNGYNYEAEAVARCFANGQSECAEMPWSESLALAETMDELRSRWGVIYPGEATS